MGPRPLVSVLTPCLNSARFLESCILSVERQDYPHVEHIVQDAGSGDETLAILRRHKDSVNWASEPDTGQSDGLNRALQRASGDIIGVLNADDEYLPHASSWAVEQLSACPDLAVVYGDQYFMDERGTQGEKNLGPVYDFEKILCVERVIPAQAAFIRRTSLEQVGFHVDVTRPTCPDFELWVRLGLAHPMRYVPGFVAKYRRHPGSEGRQGRVIRQMVASKRQVIERTLTDPATPPRLRALRPRAHSGAVWWGACMQLWIGRVPAALAGLAHSLALAPSLEQLPRLRFFFVYLPRFARRWDPMARGARKALRGVERVCRRLGREPTGDWGP